MRPSRVLGLLAFASAWLLGSREASAADDKETLIICDAVAAAPPVFNLALLVATFSLTPEGRPVFLIEDFGVALPYTAGIGGVIYLGCSPAVHAANGRPLAALGSFTARVGGPLAGVALTYGSYRVTGGTSTASIAITLTAVPMGAALAILTDYFFLTPPPVPKPRPTFAPTIQPAAGGASAGIVGSF